MGKKMIESTLKEYVDKVGTQYRAAKNLGVSLQLLVKSLQNNTPIFVSHDENLNVIRAQLVRKWGKR